MELSNFIKIYNNCFDPKIVNSLIKYLDAVDFEDATIVSDEQGNQIQDNSIRKTKTYAFSLYSSSLTHIHWNNVLYKFFSDYIEEYKKDLNIFEIPLVGISDISALKYENTGFYTYHSDHCASIPRTLSCIFMLNDDYRGGELCFADPTGKNEHCIKPESNKLIIWPSNFMYPHTVKPVTKGRRYSVVSWAS